MTSIIKRLNSKGILLNLMIIFLGLLWTYQFYLSDQNGMCKISLQSDGKEAYANEIKNHTEFNRMRFKSL